MASIRRELVSRLPESGASGQEGTVVISVQIQKDGSVSNDDVSIVSTSGIRDMDAAAQSAIRSAAPYEHLPEVYRLVCHRWD